MVVFLQLLSEKRKKKGNDIALKEDIAKLSLNIQLANSHVYIEILTRTRIGFVLNICYLRRYCLEILNTVTFKRLPPSEKVLSILVIFYLYLERKVR